MTRRVLLRVDFNVPFEYRVHATLPTIRAILKHGDTVVLATHLDKNGKILHLDSLAGFLRQYFRAIFFVKGRLRRCQPDFFEKNRERIFLLDNLRLNNGEMANSQQFAKTLASWGDYYINDAFATSHRNHASIVGLPNFLPHSAGPLFKAEIKHLSRFFKPKKPFLFILGGKKFSTKEPLIKRFINDADAIFVCGALGNAFLKQRGSNIGRSNVADEKIPKKILWSPKIFLPEDAIILRGKTKKTVLTGEVLSGDYIYDAGPRTVRALGELSRRAKSVLWNGTLGVCEKGFDYGTKELAKYLGKSKAFKVVGGGDTVAAIRKARLEKNFDFLSTGGGAMLEFLATGTLPGLAALEGEPRLRREALKKSNKKSLT